MVDAIDDHLQTTINKDIQTSDFIGLIINETTDRTVHKKLSIYFRSFKAGTCEPVIHFVDCVEVVNGKADTIVTEVVKVCERIGIDWFKVITMASDGASVMTGKKGGAGVKLRNYNPRMIQIHCVAHIMCQSGMQRQSVFYRISDYF